MYFGKTKSTTRKPDFTVRPRGCYIPLFTHPKYHVKYLIVSILSYAYRKVNKKLKRAKIFLCPFVLNIQFFYFPTNTILSSFQKLMSYSNSILSAPTGTSKNTAPFVVLPDDNVASSPLSSPINVWSTFELSA